MLAISNNEAPAPTRKKTYITKIFENAPLAVRNRLHRVHF